MMFVVGLLYNCTEIHGKYVS